MPKPAKRFTSSHISKVQKVVKERLDEIENEVKDQLLRDLEQIKMQIADHRAPKPKSRWKAAQPAGRSVRRFHRIKMRTCAMNCMELRPFTFLSESRYRELKSRWGQVFRADMGAEAFYDILRRLDLEKLSEDLWHEVKHLQEQAKTQESHHPLESG